MKLPLILTLVLLSAASFVRGQADGTVTFTIKSLPKAVGYSPKHVLAMWVADNSNKLLKNLELSAAKRVQWLSTWNAASGGVATDITSGATLSSHVTHTKTWNCRDKSGTLVPDGTYKIITEFTSEHAQGPVNIISFSKAGSKITLNPAASTYFSNINLVFTPVFATGIQNELSTDFDLEVYPNPVKDFLNISYTLAAPSQVILSIYSMNMQLIKVISTQTAVAGKNEIQWVPAQDLAKGSYVLVMQSDRFIATRKIILSK
jgi:hypothetical protein